MRLRQFGGALEHTVFKCLVRFLSPTDEPRVFDRNSGLGGEADNDLLVPCCEPSSLRMPEKRPPITSPSREMTGTARWLVTGRCPSGMPLFGALCPYRGSALMSSERTTPSPRKVGAKMAVLRGIGNLANASRGTPDRLYSM